MFDKFKELMKVKEEIDDIKAKTKSQYEAMEKFSEKFSTVEARLTTLTESMDSFITEFKENTGTLSTLREDLGKEIYDFKLLKSQLQKKLVEKFEDELKRELRVNVDTIKQDLGDYEQVKATVQEAVKKVDLTKEEMDKWLAISSRIKEADFELVKHAKKLEAADNEKLELMKKIDSLQTMVAKMRRQAPVKSKMAQY